MKHMMRVSLVGIVLLLGWQLAVQWAWIDPALLPPASSVMFALWRFITDVEFYRHVAATLALMGQGFAVALLFGIPLGVIMGLNRLLDDSFSPYVDFLRALPAAAMIPLFMLFFQGQLARILVVGFSGAMVIAVACRSGVQRVEPARDEILSLLGMSRLQRFSKLLIWEMLSELVIGLRIAIALTFVVATVVEMLLGARYGLGDLLLNSQVSNKAQMYAVIFVLGFIGYALNQILQAAQAAMVHMGMIDAR